MTRILSAIAAILAGLWLTGDLLAGTAKSSAATDCPIAAERFFAVEQPLPDGRIRASYFVLLRNPGSQTLTYALSFAHEAASESRKGARATLPGRHSLPVLLGREVLPADGTPLEAVHLAAATRLACRG